MLPESSSSKTTSSCCASALMVSCSLWPAVVPAAVSAGLMVSVEVAVVGPDVPGAEKVTVSEAAAPGDTATGSVVASARPAGSAGFTAVTVKGPVP